MRPLQWTGVALAFAGIAIAFSDGFAHHGGGTALGDAMGVLAAIAWAATTVLIRATRLTRATATKVLFYQLGVSAILLAAASPLVDRAGSPSFTPVALASLAFQSVVVAFASYLVWFWLLTRYLGGRLAVFAFLAPLFGVAFGRLVLGDPVSPAFLGAAAMVGAGIALVNARRA
jgi:drug/metabolite transporter (DMT)-like permease